MVVAFFSQALPLFIMCGILVGIDKAGIPGVANIAIILVYKLYTTASSGSLNAKQEAIGMIVPILACADVAALFMYRQYASPMIIVSILVPSLLGVLLGYKYFYEYRSSLDLSVEKIIGICFIFLFIVNMMVEAVQHYTKPKDVHKKNDDHTLVKNDDHSVESATPKKLTPFKPDLMQMVLIFVGGLCAGFITIVANVAGPVVTMMMTTILALTPQEIHGNRAYLFLALNVVKVPFHYWQGNLHRSNIEVCLAAIVATIVSTYLTKQYIYPHINAKQFSSISWFLVLLIAINLVFFEKPHNASK